VEVEPKTSSAKILVVFFLSLPFVSFNWGVTFSQGLRYHLLAFEHIVPSPRIGRRSLLWRAQTAGTG